MELRAAADRSGVGVDGARRGGRRRGGAAPAGGGRGRSGDGAATGGVGRRGGDGVRSPDPIWIGEEGRKSEWGGEWGEWSGGPARVPIGVGVKGRPAGPGGPAWPVSWAVWPVGQGGLFFVCFVLSFAFLFSFLISFLFLSV